MHYRHRIDLTTGLPYVATDLLGRDILINPLTNKGSAFSREERFELGLEGLLPRPLLEIEGQLELSYQHFLAKSTPLEKYIYLSGLHDRNETLFFRLLSEHIEEMMPIVYTPTVGEACQQFSRIYRRVRGMYIGIDQKDSIEQALRNFGVDEPAVIVVTDGERILGLGDQGAGGMGIPIGKLCLYTLCAGIPPHKTLPILLDVGTSNEERLADPLYVGMPQRRVRGEEYQAFVDRFVEAVKQVFPNVLLQFEDFLKGNALKQLERFRDQLCCFNDDVQGTAAVTVAGIFASLRVTGRSLAEERILMAGAGAASSGIGGLIVSALVEGGMSVQDARKRIWMVDSGGLVSHARTHLDDFKLRYARDVRELDAFDCADRTAIDLATAVAGVKPTILLGASAIPELFDEALVREMARHVDRPVIFPLSNPNSKAECVPEDAIRWTDGRAVVATGSPFDPVEHGGRSFRIGQCNNSYIFPGVGLGAWVGRLRRITDEMFLDAARTLADRVAESDLATGALFPRLEQIREISHAVACAVIRRAVEQGHADAEMLDDVETRVSEMMWKPEYLPVRYEPTTIP